MPTAPARAMFALRKKGEPAILLKEGAMAIAKDPEWEPTPLTSQQLVPSAGRQPLDGDSPTWSRSARGLYREPTLPIRVGARPGGNIISVDNFEGDTRDWRKLAPSDVILHVASLEGLFHSPNPQLYPTAPSRDDTEVTRDHDGIMAAVAVGTLQACKEGSYWAPSTEAADNAKYSGIRMPLSRRFDLETTPDVSALEPRRPEGELQEIGVANEACPLTTCQRLLSEPGQRRVALVRVTPAGNRVDSWCQALREPGDGQLFLRTSYLQALREMPRHLHADAHKVVDDGEVIHTADVTVLRGPVEDGALWLSDAPRLDILWVALQRSPRLDGRGEYMCIKEKAQATELVERVFAVAASLGIDTLVWPAVGVAGACRCYHPPGDFADVLRKAAIEFAPHIGRVEVSLQHRTHAGDDWSAFAASLGGERRVAPHLGLVPLKASPYVRPGWTVSERTKKLPETTKKLANTAPARLPS